MTNVEQRPWQREVLGTAVLFTIEDLTTVTSTITIARTIIAAFRRRRTRYSKPAAVTLVVKGPTIDLEVRLPADVRSSEILHCLMPLLKEIPAEVSKPAIHRQPEGEGGFQVKHMPM
jgi:hypothetical protein